MCASQMFSGQRPPWYAGSRPAGTCRRGREGAGPCSAPRGTRRQAQLGRTAAGLTPTKPLSIAVWGPRGRLVLVVASPTCAQGWHPKSSRLLVADVRLDRRSAGYSTSGLARLLRSAGQQVGSGTDEPNASRPTRPGEVPPEGGFRSGSSVRGTTCAVLQGGGTLLATTLPRNSEKAPSQPPQAPRKARAHLPCRSLAALSEAVSGPCSFQQRHPA